MGTPSSVNYTTLQLCLGSLLMPLKYRKGQHRLLVVLKYDDKQFNVVQSILRNIVCPPKRQLCTPCKDHHVDMYLLICVRILRLSVLKNCRIMYRCYCCLNWFRVKRTCMRQDDDSSAPDICGPVSDVRRVPIKSHVKFETTVFETRAYPVDGLVTFSTFQLPDNWKIKLHLFQGFER